MNCVIEKDRVHYMEVLSIKIENLTGSLIIYYMYMYQLIEQGVVRGHMSLPWELHDHFGFFAEFYTQINTLCRDVVQSLSTKLQDLNVCARNTKKN